MLSSLRGKVLAVGGCVAAAGLVAAVIGEHHRHHAPQASAAPRAVQLADLPMHFEAAPSAAGGEAAFLSRGPGYAAQLTASGTRLRLMRGATPHAAGAGHELPAVAEVQMQLLDSDPRASLGSEQKLASYSNYLEGNDPAKWRTGVEQFARVRASSVYPGVDLVYYGDGKQLEYDFIVAAAADPQTIRYRINGADALQLTDDGDLRISIGNDTLIQRKPVIYQQRDGQRVTVDGGYRLDAARQEVAFAIGAHDPQQALVIDPVLSYSTYLGGNQGDTANAIAVDASGNAYVAGSTASPNFDTVNPTGTGNGNNGDAFIAKINAAGTALVYSTYIGGSGYDTAAGVAVDSSGNAYLSGNTYSTDFPTKTPIQVDGGDNDSDVFVTKLNAAGTALVYSTYLGGSASDFGTGIALDSSGSAYVTGYTNSSNYNTLNPIQTGTAGHYHAFVSKLVPAGNALSYSTYLGGSVDDFGYAIAVDGNGSAYVTGYTYSSDFITLNPIQSYPNDGNANAFVSKLAASGSALVYSTYLGGNAYDAGNGIAVDASGNAYVTGQTASTDFITKTPIQTDPGDSNNDAFIAKINAAGAALIYSTYLGGNGSDIGYAIAVDSGGSAYVAGSTTSTDLGDPYQSDGSSGNGDAVVAKISADGSKIAYLQFLGGNGSDVAKGIAVDSSNNAYVAGSTASTDFVTAQPIQAASGGNTDAFVTKLLSPASLQFVQAAESVTESSVQVVLQVSRTGSTTGAATVNFVTSPGTATANKDYTTTTGTLTWADGDSANKTITVPIINTGVPEPNQTFTVTLSSPNTNAQLGTQSTNTVTILAHDLNGAFGFNPTAVSVGEGDGHVTLTVVRANASAGAVSVSYATVNGTATPGGDYTASSGVLNFADGQTSQTISIPIIDDTIDEPATPETFMVKLSSPTGGATLGSASTATVSIIDNDAYPGVLAFRGSAISVNEDVGTVTLAVSRSNGLTGPVTVGYATASGSATGGSDYVSTAGTLSWADGDTADKTITVSIINDDIPEGDENFTVTLSSPSGGATIGSPGTETITILANDQNGVLQFDQAYYPVNENSGNAVLTVTRSNGSVGAVSVAYATADGTATAGSDYKQTSGTLSFAQGETSKTLSIPIIDDNIAESSTPETFTVQLSAPTGGALLGSRTSSTVTITDDDSSTGTLALSAATLTVDENAGIATLAVTRSNGSAGAASVSYHTVDGTATAGSDYTATSGTLSFADGQTYQSISVPIIDDNIVESSETFQLVLSSAQSATLGSPSSATITINDNDTPVTSPTVQFSASSYDVVEGGRAHLTLLRGGPVDQAISVHVATHDNTATAPADYVAIDQIVSWVAGDSSPQSVTVLTVNDNLVETTETFTVSLDSPSTGVVIGSVASATVRIDDDDAATPLTTVTSVGNVVVEANQGQITSLTPIDPSVLSSVVVAPVSGQPDLNAPVFAVAAKVSLGADSVGGSVTLTVIPPDSLATSQDDVVVLLCNAAGSACVRADPSTVADSSAGKLAKTVTIQDGGTGDNDASANGVITATIAYATTQSSSPLNVKSHGSSAMSDRLLLLFGFLGLARLAGRRRADAVSALKTH